MLVDTHVHIGINTDEPVEMLLAQMQLNGVEKTLLVQRNPSTDNSYLIECMRRFPGRFSVVCRVDVNSPHALADVEHWHHLGAEAVRLKNFQRSPGGDPLAIWKKAQELGMLVSVGGMPDSYATPEFDRIVDELSNLKFVFEHLAGMGYDCKKPKPAKAHFRQTLKLASYPNTYIKIHGMGEICPLPFPFKDVPPYVKMAYDAFGPHRMMWGSDWPGVIRREGYRNALRFTMDHLTFCSKDDLEWIFGKTALSVWKFP